MVRVKAKAITQAEVDAREALEEQQRISDEARQYLRDTDWYVIREADTGEPVPDEVRERRQAARERVWNTNCTHQTKSKRPSSDT